MLFKYINVFSLITLFATVSTLSIEAKNYKEISTMAQYKKAFENTGPVVMMFSAPWCGPCQATKPHLDQAARKYANINFYVVDTSSSAVKSLIKKHNIQGLPTFVYFNNKQEIKRDRMGGMSKQELYQSIDEFLNTITPKASKKKKSADTKAKTVKQDKNNTWTPRKRK